MGVGLTWALFRFLIRCGGGMERKVMGVDQSSGHLYTQGFYFFSDVDIEFVGFDVKRESKL